MRAWLLSGSLAVAVLAANTAQAAVEFCNDMGVPLEAAFAYTGATGAWATKGWYSIDPYQCEIVHGADDVPAANGMATYYYYAIAFIGEDKLTWEGEETDPTARELCLGHDAFDNQNAEANCEQAKLPSRHLLRLQVPAEPGRKHVVKFSPPQPAPAAATEMTPQQPVQPQQAAPEQVQPQQPLVPAQ